MVQPQAAGPGREQMTAQGSLVLYKTRPALVVENGEKITIELEGAKRKRVRPKDITLLHPGPLASLAGLDAPRTSDRQSRRSNGRNPLGQRISVVPKWSLPIY